MASTNIAAAPVIANATNFAMAIARLASSAAMTARRDPAVLTASCSWCDARLQFTDRLHRGGVDPEQQREISAGEVDQPDERCQARERTTMLGRDLVDGHAALARNLDGGDTARRDAGIFLGVGKDAQPQPP